MAKRNRKQQANQPNNQQGAANNAFETEFANEFEANDRAAQNNAAKQRRQKNKK